MRISFLSLVTALVLATAVVSSGCGSGSANGNAASGGDNSSIEGKLTKLSGHDVRNCRKDAKSLIPDTASYECEVQDLVSKEYGPINVYLDAHGNVVGSVNW